MNYTKSSKIKENREIYDLVIIDDVSYCIHKPHIILK